MLYDVIIHVFANDLCVGIGRVMTKLEGGVDTKTGQPVEWKIRCLVTMCTLKLPNSCVHTCT